MAVFIAGWGLALAAASMVLAAEDTLEESIREALSEQGEVQQVEMTPRDKDHLSGFADLLDSQGRPWRLVCTATRAGGEQFDWTCDPVVNEAAIEDVENSIREVLGQQGTVLEVAMSRRDDDNMIGFARVSDSRGVVSRSSCTAARQSEGSRVFDWNCTQVVDEVVIADVENNIRQELGRQGTVLEVALSRRDDDSMAGFARIRDRRGAVVRASCVARRQSAGSRMFNWSCEPD